MSPQIVRQRSIAFAREDDAAKGTAVAASTGHYVSCDDAQLKREVEQVRDTSGTGRVESGIRHFKTKEWSTLRFSAPVKTDWVGHVLTGLLGTVSSATVSAAQEHTLSVLNSVALPAYTFFMLDSLDPVKATYGTFTKITLKCTAGGVLMADVEAIAQKCVTGTGTPAFSTDYPLLGAHGSLKFASAISGLTAASAIGFAEAELTIERDVTPHYTLGSDTPTSFIGGKLDVSGSLKILKEGTTYSDLFKDATDKAFRFDFNDTATAIGTNTPQLQLDVAKIYLSESERPGGMDEPDFETFTFNGNYDLDEGTPQMIAGVLTNTESTTAYTEPA